MRLLLSHAHASASVQSSVGPTSSSATSSASSASGGISGGAGGRKGGHGQQKQPKAPRLSPIDDLISPIVRARMEPEVGGINRYRHFHRPLASPSLVFKTVVHNCAADADPHSTDNNGQSIDKTSPRRSHSSNSQNRIQQAQMVVEAAGVYRLFTAATSPTVLPAIASPLSPAAMNYDENGGSTVYHHDAVENNSLAFRPRARTTTAVASGVQQAKSAGNRLPPLIINKKKLLPPMKSAAAKHLPNGIGAEETKEGQQQKRRETTATKGVEAATTKTTTKTPAERGAAAVKVSRRRIIISDGADVNVESGGSKRTAEAVPRRKQQPMRHMDSSSSDQLDPARVQHQPSGRRRRKAAILAKAADKEEAEKSGNEQKDNNNDYDGATRTTTFRESVGTQTEGEENGVSPRHDGRRSNGGSEEDNNNNNSLTASKAAIPRATQTEQSESAANGQLHTAEQQRTQLLAIIEDALDETIDRQSRLRTNEFIASTARNQAQIWRDAKEFVALHLLPQSITLASRTRHRSREGSSSVTDQMHSYERALKSIQLP